MLWKTLKMRGAFLPPMMTITRVLHGTKVPLYPTTEEDML